jgi:hypothetical protein
MIRYGEMHLYNQFIHILEWLGGNEPTEDEVWEVARESECIPVFENVLYDIVLKNIKLKLGKSHPNLLVEYFINDTDTHLWINNTNIYSMTDLLSIIETEEHI